MNHLPFFLASFTWNYGLGMTYVVVPLYAHHLGLSGAQIGTLFSTPVLIQMAVNLAGGAYADRNIKNAARDVFDEKSEEIVGKLFQDYCGGR